MLLGALASKPPRHMSHDGTSISSLQEILRTLYPARPGPHRWRHLPSEQRLRTPFVGT
jgi:hypothetical protein